jgi:hypothetical protein
MVTLNLKAEDHTPVFDKLSVPMYTEEYLAANVSWVALKCLTLILRISMSILVSAKDLIDSSKPTQIRTLMTYELPRGD